MTDLLSLKQDFCDIVQKAQPWILSHFVMWLDLKVAEYKVYGYMVLEQSTSLISEPKVPPGNVVRTSQSSNTSPTAASSESPGQSNCQQFSPRAPCLVVPRPNLSIDRAQTSTSSSISASTTPIFKRPLFGGRANRRKQQHVYRRSSTSLLTALSSDIYNTVGIQSGRRDGEDRRKDEYVGAGEIQPKESDLSISSSVSQSVSDSSPNHGSGIENSIDAKGPATEIDASQSVLQSVSPSGNSPDGATARMNVEKARRSLSDLFSESKSEGGRRFKCSDLKSDPATVEDDMEVLSSQYEELNRSTEDCIVVEENDHENTEDPAQEGSLRREENNETSEAEHEIKSELDTSGDKDVNNVNNQVPKCDTQCSSSLPESTDRNDGEPSLPRVSLSSKNSSSSLDKRQSPSTSTHKDESTTSQTSPQIKQEASVLGGIQIKLEPVDTSPTDMYYHSPGSSNQPSSSGSLLHQQLSYSNSNMAGPGYFEGIDWNAVSFNQYLDNSQGFSNGTSPTSSNQDGRSCQRSAEISPTTPSKSDPSLTCNLCGAVFRFKSSLSRHKTLHGEKRFHCFVCPKAFHRREHLLLHLQRHANSAMITCPVCHMQASSVKHLEEHYRLNHGPFKRTGVMPYLARDNTR